MGAVPYTQLCETKTWWDHLWTTVRFQKLRGVWKPMQGLGRRSHILNSETTLWGNHHSINTLFHWEEFENLCWFYTKKCHKLKSAKEKCGEIVFRLTSGFRKWKLKTYVGPTELGPYVKSLYGENVLQITFILFQKLRSAWKPMQGLGGRENILKSETLWGSHLSINTLFTEKCLKTYAASTQKVPHAQICKTTLWWNRLSNNIWVHLWEVFQKQWGLMRKMPYIKLGQAAFGETIILFHQGRKVWKTLLRVMRKVTNSRLCENIPWSKHLSTHILFL